MKIIYFSQHPNLNLMQPDGPGTHMREVINSFSNLGHEVLTLISGGTELKKNTSAQSKNAQFKNFAKKIIPEYVWESVKDFQLYNSNKRAERILSEQIQKFHPDLIYERGGYMQVAGVRTAKKFDIKHFVEINAPLTDEKNLLQAKSLLTCKSYEMEREILFSADKIFVVSSKLKEYFIDKFMCDESKIVVTPNAVNPEKIQTNEKKINEIRAKYNLTGKTIIGFVGSIFKYHGIDILLDAFQKISAQKSNVILIIVGDGEILEELKVQTQFQNLSDKIIFTGYVSTSEVFNYMEIFDIAVLPKTKEYMSPIKIFEYGAIGKAIVAPDVSSVRDVMENEADGLLVYSDTDGIYSAILRLLDNENLRNYLGENFRKKVLSEHTWKKNVQKILSFS